jgi:hypothetical protein
MRRKVMVSRRFTSDGSVATLLAGTVVVVFVLLAASRSMAAGGLEGQRAQTF